MELAHHALRGPAVVIDYELQGTTNQFTFQSDTTYLVTGPFVVTYPTIEGGTVVKFTKGSSSSIEVPIGGWVNCQTAPYRPAIFTAKDDNSVGETMPGSTGNPATNYYAETVFKLHDANHFLSNLRIAHARVGISLDDGWVTVRHGQFVHCQQAVALNWCAAYLQNVLLHGVSNVFAGDNFRASSAQHLTVHECDTFSDDGQTGSPIGLTNCLLIQVTNWGTSSLTTHAVATGAVSSVFQAVGAGWHYLANNSTYRDAGTTNINVALLAELRERTTFPPQVLTNTITTNILT